jgi:hypothetical protein
VKTRLFSSLRKRLERRNTRRAFDRDVGFGSITYDPGKFAAIQNTEWARAIDLLNNAARALEAIAEEEEFIPLYRDGDVLLLDNDHTLTDPDAIATSTAELIREFLTGKYTKIT